MSKKRQTKKPPRKRRDYPSWTEAGQAKTAEALLQSIGATLDQIAFQVEQLKTLEGRGP